jgi:hypothetical protein
MKINEAPQDKEDFKGKSTVRKVLYVTQKDGSYTKINSDGWEVENMATRQAWEAVSEDLEEIEQKVKDGRLSPVAYYMHKCLMELPVLAKYMKKWEWQVKRHFKPGVFQKLNEKTLEQYAKVFNVSVKELKQFNAGKKVEP